MLFDVDLWEWAKSLPGLLRERTISVLVASLMALAAGAWAWWRARRAWNLRQFLHRVNFSLNYVEGKKLRFRTLQETDLSQVLLNNRHAVGLVLQAAGRATLEQPILELPKQEAWVVLNSVLNEMSEQFAAGFLAKSMGLSTHSERYIFALTCEKDPDMRINKVRVMIVTESLLGRIEGLADLEFEAEHHHIRRKTLAKMAAMHRDAARKHNLLTVELTLPTNGTMG
jgi:hypothetical protein